MLHQGLSEQEVLLNREKYGENVLTPPKKTPLWKQFLEKFADPIIRILLIALVLSIGVAFYEFFTTNTGLSIFFEPIGILIAVLLATGVGFAFEVSANKKFEILNQVNDDTLVKVIRNGNVSQVSKRDLVVGDVVILEQGEEIPADGKLLEAVSLQVNESTLTGEPIIKKTINPSQFEQDATYPSNIVLRGTTVVEGHGIFEVTNVGDNTEYGKVYEGSQVENKIKTPLNIQLEKLSRWITFAGYSIAALIIVGRLTQYFLTLDTFVWLDFGHYFLNTLMIAVVLIVMAVPEGLPMSVTLSLALNMRRMLDNNSLVRKMHACETIGAASVICTDKTGTLTQNQMQVTDTLFFNVGAGHAPPLQIINEGISVNTTAFLDLSEEKPKVLGNPTEGALLLWLNASGVNYLNIRNNAKIAEQLPFSTERKYMATLVEKGEFDEPTLYVKGAPEYVMQYCETILVDGVLKPLSEYKLQIETQLSSYQNRALRTLAIAYKHCSLNESVFKDGRLAQNNLTFLGLFAIADPVRSDAPEAIQNCISAGIDVKMLTGDTAATAKEIGRQVGLWTNDSSESNHLTGPDFSELSDDELLNRVLDLKIMSRARPMDKERLVRLLQQKNQVVAVTGDGTNDAPALNMAQVGLSMGDGTTVAKEASAITIMDNSFSSITKAVMWGRSLYKNIQRFILFQLTINVAACTIVLIGAFLGTEPPLTITQILWVNLIIDTFAALALASLPPNENVMHKKPRNPNAHIITKPMGRQILGTGFGFAFILLALLLYFKHYGDGFSPYERSLFFTFFVLLQFWNLFNAKAFASGHSALHQLHKTLKGFGLVMLAILGGQYLIVTFGGQMFGVTPISWQDWLILFGATSLVLWFGEIKRLFAISRH